MITFRHKGNFKKTDDFLRRAEKGIDVNMLHKYGKEGVAALASVTPVDTGLTANSWYYKIERRQGSVAVVFCNSNIQNGVPIAIILHYGHGTRYGGWVEGTDYINPTIKPIFNKLVKDAWREVTRR